MFMAKRQNSGQDSDKGTSRGAEIVRSEAPSELLRELVAHLRQNRTQLREEWVSRISETRLLTAMTKGARRDPRQVFGRHNYWLIRATRYPCANRSA